MKVPPPPCLAAMPCWSVRRAKVSSLNREKEALEQSVAQADDHFRLRGTAYCSWIFQLGRLFDLVRQTRRRKTSSRISFTPRTGWSHLAIFWYRPRNCGMVNPPVPTGKHVSKTTKNPAIEPQAKSCAKPGLQIWERSIP